MPENERDRPAPTPPSVPPGWYPDPAGGGRRYWDGKGWLPPGQIPRPARSSGFWGGLPLWAKIGVGILGLVVIASLAVNPPEDSDNADDAGTDTVQKDAGDIESDISDTMNAPKYQDLVQGEVTIDCPDYTPEQLFDAGKTVQCSAEDGAGNFTDFDLKPAGKQQYQYSPGNIAVGLTVGGA